MSKQYHHIDDFISDENFKQWVKDPTPENSDFWINWLKENEESEQLFKQAKVIINGMKFQDVESISSSREELLLEGIMKKSPKIQQHSVGFWMGNNVLLKIAAMLVAVLSISFYLYQSNQIPVEVTEVMVTKENPKGVKSKVRLPDGTKVWLNAGSSISYTKGFTESIRAVELSGEAYFEVVKNENKPFVVRVMEVEIIALGTAFDINAFNTDQVEVYLTEGKVKVSSDKEVEPEFLSPGEMVSATPSSGKLIKDTFRTDDVVAWTKEIIVFKQATFEEVSKVLGRWYGVGFEIVNSQNMDDWSYSAKFKNKSLEEVLDIISQTEKFDYEMENQNVKLSF